MDALTIDAVALVRHIRDQNYQRLLDKSPDERLAFYHEQARLMNAKALALVQNKNRPGTPQISQGEDIATDTEAARA